MWGGWDGVKLLITADGRGGRSGAGLGERVGQRRVVQTRFARATRSVDQTTATVKQ